MIRPRAPWLWLGVGSVALVVAYARSHGAPSDCAKQASSPGGLPSSTVVPAGSVDHSANDVGAQTLERELDQLERSLAGDGGATPGRE
jgi:hypothetical protein